MLRPGRRLRSAILKTCNMLMVMMTMVMIVMVIMMMVIAVVMAMVMAVVMMTKTMVMGNIKRKRKKSAQMCNYENWDFSDRFSNMTRITIIMITVYCVHCPAPGPIRSTEPEEAFPSAKPKCT